MTCDKILALKYAPLLRTAYQQIPEHILELNSITMQYSDPLAIINIDYDVIFLGSDRCMIYMTNLQQYYLRICKGDYGLSNCQSGICLEDECQSGFYFSEFTEALNFALSWLKTKLLPDKAEYPAPQFKVSLF